MPRAEHSKREVLAVACKCWRSLLAPGGPGFSGQAVSHIELELDCMLVHCFSLWARVFWYIKGSGGNIARFRVLPDDFSLLDELVKARHCNLAEFHVPGYRHGVMVESMDTKNRMQVALYAEQCNLPGYDFVLSNNHSC